jgi:glycosyltransferase involved in cell wall biosynthesis
LHEGISVSLMEAMAHGLPAVGTNTGGIPELLGGGAGVIVDEKNAEALADAIEKLIVDACHRQSMAAAGRERIRESFDVRSIAAKLLLCIEGQAKPEQLAGIGRREK